MNLKNNELEKKAIAAIEICADVIKVVVGYKLKGDALAIIFSKTFPLKIKNIDIFEKKEILKNFLNALNIEDKSLKLKIKIKKAIIVLPSFNLNILEVSKKKSVSNLKKIDFIDMENIISSIRKIEDEISNEKIVDIIPLNFQYDTGSSTQFPVNMISNTLEIRTSLQLLPKTIVDNYDDLLKRVCNSCNFNYKYIVSSQAKTFLLGDGNFLCIDIKRHMTDVDLILDGKVICSKTFALGTKQLIENLKFKFELDDKKAEEIISFFGFDKRVLTFDPVIYQNFKNEEERFFKISDLNEIIKEYLDAYLFTLNNCLKEIFKEHEDKNYNFLIMESDFKIRGFFEFIKDSYEHRNVKKINLKVIGLRDEKYLACAGAILSMTKKYNYNNLIELE